MCVETHLVETDSAETHGGIAFLFLRFIYDVRLSATSSGGSPKTLKRVGNTLKKSTI